MWNRLTETARRAVWAADEAARDAGEAEVGPDHLVLGVLAKLEGLRVSLTEAGVDFGRLAAAARPDDAPGKIAREPVGLHPRAKKIIDFAAREADGQKRDYIGVGHLFLGILAACPEFQREALGPDGDLQAVRAAVEKAYDPGTKS